MAERLERFRARLRPHPLGRGERAARQRRDRRRAALRALRPGVRCGRHLLQQCRLPRICAATGPSAWSVTLAAHGPRARGNLPARDRLRRRSRRACSTRTASPSAMCRAIAAPPRVTVEAPGIGPRHGDIAWGGNWFFLVGDHGQALTLDRLEELTDYAWRVRQGIERQGITGADGGEIDHIELFGPPTAPGRRQQELRPLSRQGLRPLAVRHRHQREARLPVRRRQAAARRRCGGRRASSAAFSKGRSR